MLNKLLLKLHRKMQRNMDRRYLWPACKKKAGTNKTAAQIVFMMHASQDKAWTTDFTTNEILEKIRELE